MGFDPGIMNPSEESEPTPADGSIGQFPRGGDRRKRPTHRFSRYTLSGGRRRSVRRDSEREGSFVDLYSLPILLAVAWIALMNILDSYFTLVHLQAGGIELNPVADQLLQTGRFGFVFLKCSLIGFALTVLCLHKNFRLARVGLWTSAVAYTVLVGYHLMLFQA